MGPNFKMDPAVKQLWLDALRSGEYEQGQEVLRSWDNTYCCLGVLCDLAVKNGVIEEPVPVSIDDNRDGYRYGSQSGSGGSSIYLPWAVKEWAKVGRYGDRSVDFHSALPGEYRQPLSQLNDEGKSFNEIADIIEAEF